MSRKANISSADIESPEIVWEDMRFFNERHVPSVLLGNLFSIYFQSFEYCVRGGNLALWFWLFIFTRGLPVCNTISIAAVFFIDARLNKHKMRESDMM